MKMDRYSNGRATAEQAASQMLSATMCVCAGVYVSMSMCMCVPECVCVCVYACPCVHPGQPTNQPGDALAHTQNRRKTTMSGGKSEKAENRKNDAKARAKPKPTTTRIQGGEWCDKIRPEETNPMTSWLPSAVRISFRLSIIRYRRMRGHDIKPSTLAGLTFFPPCRGILFPGKNRNDRTLGIRLHWTVMGQ